jgi:membrane-associated phospholipid phosphatase
MQQLNHKNLSVATWTTSIVAVILITLSFVFDKESFFLLFNNDLGHTADFFFANITKGGEVVPWVVALLAVLIWRRDLFWLLLASFFISTLFVQGIKNILPDEPRPTKAITNTHQVHIVEGVELYKVHSFPSGHTSAAFTVFFIACLAFKSRWVVALGLIYAFLVAYSRIYLAEHFPRDIAGGMIIAVVTIYLGLWICKRENHLAVLV